MKFFRTIISEMRFGARAISVLLAALMTAPVTAPAQQPVVQPASRPKVALVFEGGGALGFAHIGVIQWIEEHHIPVDYVAGTSMGGLVGGLYASGMNAQQISDFMAGIDWTAVLSGQGAISGFELQAEGRQARVSEPAGVWLEAWGYLSERFELRLGSGSAAGREDAAVLRHEEL
jgi:hypothetical protein